MMHADLSQFPDFLRSRRWFAGRAWPIKRVSVVDHVQVLSRRSTFTLGVVDVHYEMGNPERYFVPVTVDARGALHDAMEDDELARALARFIRDAAQLPSGGGRLVGSREELSEPIWSELPPAPAVHRIEAEQSNSSVVLEEKIVLKVIRRLESGPCPEVEMGRHLARVGYTGAPRFAGSLVFQGVADSTIALAHEYVPGAVDGWRHVTQALSQGKPALSSLQVAVRQLGIQVGQLHRALAAPSEDPAFTPQPIGTEDLQRWSSSIIGELGVTLSQAERALPGLLRRRDALRDRAQRLSKLVPGGLKTRVHGDLHLGQVLKAPARPGGWVIFDFEGEPGRSFAARRELTSPLKDVAGLLRSFDYAEATAAKERVSTGAAASFRQAFLDGYLEAARGSSFLPPDEETFWGLLDAFELEKALYEVRYELGSRPSWAEIPARALMEEART